MSFFLCRAQKKVCQYAYTPFKGVYIKERGHYLKWFVLGNIGMRENYADAQFFIEMTGHPL